MLVTLALAALAVLPSQDPQKIMQTVHARQVARWDTVRNYAVVQSIMGNQVALYHEKIAIDGQPVFRSIPQSLWTGRTAADRQQDREMMAGMATGLDMIADAHEKETPGPMAGVVRSMTNDMSRFARAMSTVPEPGDGRAEAAESVRGMAEFTRRAKLVGRVAENGRDAFHLRADDLSDIELEQPSDGGRFTLQTAEFWIDAAEYVPLRMTMHGTMEADGRKAPVTIELLQQNYKAVGSLYESQRQVMRITGLMEAMTADPKQRKDLEKARKQMEKMKADRAKMEEQMAKLSPAQRKMIEGRMKQAMAQMDMMLGDGVMETTVERSILSINQGPPVDWKPTFGR
jgi:hypothetical protein